MDLARYRSVGGVYTSLALLPRLEMRGLEMSRVDVDVQGDGLDLGALVGSASTNRLIHQSQRAELIS